MAMQFRLTNSQRYLVVGLVGLVGLVRLRLPLTVIIMVSRVSASLDISCTFYYVPRPA